MTTTTSIRSLEPSALWNNFADLNAVPRPSKKEEQVIRFIKEFGQNLGLDTLEDEAGNVIIRKPASSGMENRQTIVLQSHLDMVHQKNADTDFDFLTQGIEMVVEGDWVKAKGTTLGADNGIGVATIMALLQATDVAHPPLEALFTIDEETGMTGALALKGGLLKASIMLNLDTEDDQELTIGCAGGVDVTAIGSYEQVNAEQNSKGYRLSLKGLTGGHSGMDIHLGRGNANKLMNRLLHQAATQYNIQISSIDGGGLRNAIPRESFAELSVAASNSSAFESFIKEHTAVLKTELATTDPKLEVQLQSMEAPEKVLAPEFQATFLRAVYACPNGIYRMTPDMVHLVQTSNNVARVQVKNGNFSVQCLTRSSVDSEKEDLARAIEATFELTGAQVEQKGSYPGWSPRPGATIVKLMSELYHTMFQAAPHVNACHAGLECGIIGANYPDMEMISFGPNIRGAHSPDEQVQISSVQKYWNFLLKTLKSIPEQEKAV
ncbi:aminoacyl-histidine dipeptidase [Pontibacter sp. 13R65]|uniref:aminoacyl-histidine dipeptidase n=1 Tax=Pontibacter sp. 13R65 TaxID=3127458 RepID=UPI00301D767C